MQSGKGSRELLIGVAASDGTALISNGSRAVGEMRGPGPSWQCPHCLGGTFCDVEN